MSKPRILVAMSGGVDSTVAAALLLDEGFTVEGLTLRLFPEDREGEEDEPTAQRGAAAAEALGIPHRVIDRSDAFTACVVRDFIAEYARGRTPNPCVLCNPGIKFAALLETAATHDIPWVATGHYARVTRDDRTDRFTLARGVDEVKDQSYFLYRLEQSQLSHVRLPLGGLTKSEVRGLARDLRLPALERPESQEICFIPDHDRIAFLKDRAPEAFRPGAIVDPSGRRLGRHPGLIHFTVGQRRGLGIAAPHPLYVLELRPESDTVVVGPEEALLRDRLTTARLHWISGEPPAILHGLRAKIRARHTAAEASFEPLEAGRALVKFSHPQRAAAPGQAVVFYDGDTVLGGGLIESSGGGSHDRLDTGNGNQEASS